ncbi:UNVERIFIED_CONTAM: hypothetical protein FKN15_064058 [Acipenser sinensis]
MNTHCPPKLVPSADRFFSHCRLTMQPPKSYSVGGQCSSWAAYRQARRRLARLQWLLVRGRGRQPIDIRLSVMAVTRRGLPIENITGAEALVESCGDGEPQKKKRETEQSISSSRGETLGSPVYER